MGSLNDYLANKRVEANNGLRLTEIEIKRLLGIPLELSSARVDITPEAAEIILSRNNTNNRPISSRRVSLWEKSMESGFYLSNDMITFDNSGVLTNGQHRLTALVKYGKPQPFFVGFGVKNFMGMDTNKTRSVVDNALIFEECDSRLRSKEMARAHRIVKGAYYFNTGSYKSFQKTQKEYLDCSNKYANQLLDLYNAGVFSSITVTLGGKRKYITSTSVFSAYFLAYICGVDLDTLVHIHDILRTGVSGDAYNKPILALRELLLTTEGGGATSDTIRHTAVQDCIYRVCKKSKAKKVLTGKYYYIVKDL